MKRRTVLRSLMALGGAAGAAPAWARAAAQADPAAGLLTQSYPDLQGRPQALAQWKGRPMLVNFWATWCPPCVKEMPELDELHRQHAGVQFLGLAVDSAPNVVKFVSKLPVSYTLLVAGASSIELMRKLGNGPGALPFTVLLDADGRIRHQVLGPVNVIDINKWLAEITA